MQAYIAQSDPQHEQLEYGSRLAILCWHHVGHVHFMLFVSCSLMLGSQRKRAFWWNTGYRDEVHVGHVDFMFVSFFSVWVPYSLVEYGLNTLHNMICKDMQSTFSICSQEKFKENYHIFCRVVFTFRASDTELAPASVIASDHNLQLETTLQS